ncbi:hypothetical protein ACFV6E_28635 [Streptomyces sp. NPDC059785]|uniref:hypothetical protein n=1 Tax=Streptomyces sp. NPDC059785 TaxID=3346945 RepID=UPI0036578F3C
MNVEKLPHYWASLPGDSPLKEEYAPPVIAATRYLLVLAMVVTGIIVATSDHVLLGLLIAVAGLLWGTVMRRRTLVSSASLTEYESEHICLACTGRFKA